MSEGRNAISNDRLFTSWVMTAQEKEKQQDN